jgi:intraflagellar transport protein 74
MKEMEDEMSKFADVNLVRQEGEARKKLKVQERDQLKNHLTHLRKATNALATKFNETKQTLRWNEIDGKLAALEKEIRARASEGRNTTESIEKGRRQADYTIVKRHAMDLVSGINALL